MTVRLCTFAALTTVLVGGCSAASDPRLLGPVPIAPGSASQFSALVPVPSGPQRCEVGERDDQTEGRVLSLVRETKVQQRISVTLDAEGVPVRYIDVRGDVFSVGDDGGDRTTIGLYLAEGYAVAANRVAGRSPELLEIPLAEARVSANLNLPGVRMEEVLSQCGQAI